MKKLKRWNHIFLALFQKELKQMVNFLRVLHQVLYWQHILNFWWCIYTNIYNRRSQILITNIIYLITSLTQVCYMAKVYNIHIYVYQNIVMIWLNDILIIYFINLSKCIYAIYCYARRKQFWWLKTYAQEHIWYALGVSYLYWE